MDHSELIDIVDKRTVNSDLHVLKPAFSYWLSSFTKQAKRNSLVITHNQERALDLYNNLLEWCGNIAQIYLLPENDYLPFERQMNNYISTHKRIECLDAVSRSSFAYQKGSLPVVIIASIASATQKTISSSQFRSSVIDLSVSQSIDIAGFVHKCLSMGYENHFNIEMPGSISRRGGIVDVFSPGMESPVRIEFLGNNVESMRLFDVQTQKSLETVGNCRILPAKEWVPQFIDKREAEEFCSLIDFSNCNLEIQEAFNQDLISIVSGHPVQNSVIYNGAFCKESILNFLSRDSILLFEQQDEIATEAKNLDEHENKIRLNKEKRGLIPFNLPSARISWDEFLYSADDGETRLNIEHWQNDVTQKSEVIEREYQFEFCKDYNGKFESLIADILSWRKNNEKTVLISKHSKRLEELLSIHKIPISTDDIAQTSVAILSGSIDGGWDLSTNGKKFHVITDKELTGYVKERPKEKLSQIQQQSFLSELEIDGHLVHIDHGIGIFRGIMFLEEGNSKKEYLELEYAEKDKLYVPTDQLDRVTRYIAPGNRTPSLTRLGSQEWHRIKERATESTFQLAQQLLSIYKSRETEKGIQFSIDTPWQLEMEDFFVHTETEDQLRSIKQVKSDMENSKPMDRLVCGDVGYGKTEVAIRAIFKAIMDGLQVAFLAPTTVLAQQHYETLKKRFAPYPINVEVLSRFKTHKDQKQILSDIANGAIDVCIGTHRLLQNDVDFKNLGLIVVDEEQRFGVSHKEKLRALGSNADLLTLTATPIPRTLHMALTGIKDMSTIETPPSERLSINTYVSAYDDELIKQAVYREIDRGGQIFFLHNKVQTINRTAEKLSRLIPEAKITVAHGQMSENDLATAMERFARKETDILVCTTIIEAGLDMPNVNTLIVERADTFGLSQLYQLRGRVGRSSNQAYTYLLIPPSYQLSSVAEKRLQTILSATELGSGFRIAMKDLEIRGAGNILGSEQSGHINAIGYELYSQILADTVHNLKIESSEYKTDDLNTGNGVKVTLPLPCYIPDSYIADVATRLDVYQRLSRDLSPNELEDMSRELIDRFGEIPNELLNLIYVVTIRILAIQSNVRSISQQGSNTIVQMNNPIEGARILLQRQLNGLALVGNAQIRLKISKNWQTELTQVMEKLSSFKHFTDSLK